MLQKGVYNAVKICLNVRSNDRVVIVGDHSAREVDEALRDEARTITKDVLVLKIEDYGKRPIREFPRKLRDDIAAFAPTVSIYAAGALEGELDVFRMPLVMFLTETLNCKHAHMVGITKQVMAMAMSEDYNKLSDICRKVFDTVSTAKEIKVTSPKGTDITAVFDPALKWINSNGIIERGRKWQNLPGTEVYTCVKDINGTIVADEAGDYFAGKYGVFSDSVTFKIKEGYVWDVACRDKVIEKEIKQYIFTGPFCNRIGEFAFGTNVGLTKLVGNFLQDEKYPGVHIAIGHGYPKQTGASWDAPKHLDVIPLDVSVFVDGKEFMKNGRFLFE